MCDSDLASIRPNTNDFDFHLCQKTQIGDFEAVKAGLLKKCAAMPMCVM